MLSMVLVASAQALFFNIAEHDVAWARAALGNLSWADTFLQKGTLWLAFVGASLATHHDKHICIDVLPRLVSTRAAAMMRTFSSFVAGLVAFVLARVFFQACLVADVAVPFEYEVLGSDGPVHVCDAAASTPHDVGRPVLLCSLRGVLSLIHVRVSSGAGIAQLIVPLMFVLIGLRLLGRSIQVGLTLTRGDTASRAGPPKAPEDAK